jgi:hypothetical protein
MTIHLTAPTSWQALTEQQVVFVARVLGQQPSKEELLLRCLLRFTGLSVVPVTGDLRRRCALLGKPVPSRYRYNNKIIEISDEDMAAFCRQLEYLASPPAPMACPSAIAGLHGPDPQLWTNTFEEYLMADRYYRAHSNLPNYPALQKETGPAFLHKMAAVLYRPQNTPYADTLVEANARRFRGSAAADQCNALFLWWTGVKLWLKEKYSDLFAPGDGDPATDESDAVLNMLYAITEGRAHENERVYKTSVHDILHALNTKAKTIREINSKKS